LPGALRTQAAEGSAAPHFQREFEAASLSARAAFSGRRGTLRAPFRRHPEPTATRAPMTAVETLIECRWAVPVRPRGALDNHAVAIDQGRIVALLPIEEARRRYRPAQRVELPNHVVTPGLVNAHTHAAMALLRGVGDDLPLMRWLNERIWPLEKALVSEEFVYDGTRLAALEMLRSGVTCCSDMYFFPDACARALRDVGMRGVVGIIAIEFPSAYAADAEDYLRKGLATRDALRDDRTRCPTPRWPASRCWPRNSTCPCTCTCTRRSTRSTNRSRSTACGRWHGSIGSGW
jgi:hypothetical protein